MFERIWKDESGMAMGLAIMVMVIVGVMGAGLLVFVRNDLQSVIEVNQGQRAADVAEAGVQAAKQQIQASKNPGHYDLDDGSGCDSGDEAAPEGEDWSPVGGGVSRDFAGGRFTTTIQWLNPDDAAPDECVAPETGTPPEAVEFFRVISTGTFGNATRRVEAIYSTRPLNVPRAYYTPGSVDIRGSACIDSVSLFSGSNITIAGTGSGCGDGSKIRGPDLAYGNWAEPPADEFNTTPRTGPTATRTLPDGTEVTDTRAGLAAVGTISNKRSGLDYDRNSSPSFVAAPTSEPQSSSEITFPFDVGEQPDANRLCDIARQQGNYTADPTTAGTTNLTDWPAGSTSETVVCYEFTNTSSSRTLRWSVGGNENLTGDYEDCRGPIREGTLVIRNGGFSIKSGNNVALFRGVVVTRGPEELLESEVGDADLTGNNCLDGFINSTGPITIAGSVTPSSSEMGHDRPGFYGVELWSWRELYE